MSANKSAMIFGMTLKNEEQCQISQMKCIYQCTIMQIKLHIIITIIEIELRSEISPGYQEHTKGRIQYSSVITTSKIISREK